MGLRILTRCIIATALVATTSMAGDGSVLDWLDPARPLDRAILDAYREVEKQPDSAEARIRLGNTYLDAAFIDLALSEFEEATTIEPDNSIAWNNVGVVEMRRDNVKQARRAFERAIEANPRNGEARYNLAHVLWPAGDFDGAVEQMSMALLINPELGDDLINPRAVSSKVLLPARLNLYNRVLASRTLSTMGAAGEPSYSYSAGAPWLGQARPQQPDLPFLEPPPAEPPAPRPAEPQTSPQAVPTPIELGVDDVSSAPEANATPTVRRTGSGRTIRTSRPRRRN